MDFLSVFPTRTKAPAKTTILHLIKKLKKKGHSLDCHSKVRGGKSGHPLTVLTPRKLTELAVIKCNFEKQPTDVSVNTWLNNILNLMRSTFHRGAKILKNFSYRVVTYPAATPPPCRDTPSPC